METLEIRNVLSTITVTTVNDVVNENDGVISLREAVQAANPAGGDIIRFAPTLNGATINLTLGTHIEFGKSLTIDASSVPAGITIRGNDPDRGQPGEVLGNGSRIFDITNPSGDVLVTLRNLTLTGSDAGHPFFLTPEPGGAIRSVGRLVIQNCTIEGNYASQGGGIDIRTPGDTANHVDALVIENSIISNNRAEGGAGGGVYAFIASAEQPKARVTVTGSTIEENHATSSGGGLFISFGSLGQAIGETTDTSLLIDRSTIADNTSDFRGGGMHVQGNSGTQWTLRDSTISGNSANHGTIKTYGGGVYAPDYFVAA